MRRITENILKLLVKEGKIEVRNNDYRLDGDHDRVFFILPAGYEHFGMKCFVDHARCHVHEGSEEPCITKIKVVQSCWVGGDDVEGLCKKECNFSYFDIPLNLYKKMDAQIHPDVESRMKLGLCPECMK